MSSSFGRSSSPRRSRTALAYSVRLSRCRAGRRPGSGRRRGGAVERRLEPRRDPRDRRLVGPRPADGRHRPAAQLADHRLPGARRRRPRPTRRAGRGTGPRREAATPGARAPRLRRRRRARCGRSRSSGRAPRSRRPRTASTRVPAGPRPRPREPLPAPAAAGCASHPPRTTTAATSAPVHLLAIEPLLIRGIHGLVNAAKVGLDGAAGACLRLSTGQPVASRLDRRTRGERIDRHRYAGSAGSHGRVLATRKPSQRLRRSGPTQRRRSGRPDSQSRVRQEGPRTTLRLRSPSQ